jgi:hypothetical protein
MFHVKQGSIGLMLQDLKAMVGLVFTKAHQVCAHTSGPRPGRRQTQSAHLAHPSAHAPAVRRSSAPGSQLAVAISVRTPPYRSPLTARVCNLPSNCVLVMAEHSLASRGRPAQPRPTRRGAPHQARGLSSTVPSPILCVPPFLQSHPVPAHPTPSPLPVSSVRRGPVSASGCRVRSRSRLVRVSLVCASRSVLCVVVSTVRLAPSARLDLVCASRFCLCALVPCMRAGPPSVPWSRACVSVPRLHPDPCLRPDSAPPSPASLSAPIPPIRRGPAHQPQSPRQSAQRTSAVPASYWAHALRTYSASPPPRPPCTDTSVSLTHA